MSHKDKVARRRQRRLHRPLHRATAGTRELATAFEQLSNAAELVGKAFEAWGSP